MLETTPKQRLEFYEWALNQINENKETFICHAAMHHFNLSHFVDVVEFSYAFPELYKHRTTGPDFAIYWYVREERKHALISAIIETRKKI